MRAVGVLLRWSWWLGVALLPRLAVGELILPPTPDEEDCPPEEAQVKAPDGAPPFTPEPLTVVVDRLPVGEAIRLTVVSGWFDHPSPPDSDVDQATLSRCEADVGIAEERGEGVVLELTVLDCRQGTGTWGTTPHWTLTAELETYRVHVPTEGPSAFLGATPPEWMAPQLAVLRDLFLDHPRMGPQSATLTLSPGDSFGPATRVGRASGLSRVVPEGKTFRLTYLGTSECEESTCALLGIQVEPPWSGAPPLGAGALPSGVEVGGYALLAPGGDVRALRLEVDDPSTPRGEDGDPLGIRGFDTERPGPWRPLTIEPFREGEVFGIESHLVVELSASIAGESGEMRVTESCSTTATVREWSAERREVELIYGDCVETSADEWSGEQPSGSRRHLPVSGRRFRAVARNNKDLGLRPRPGSPAVRQYVLKHLALLTGSARWTAQGRRVEGLGEGDALSLPISIPLPIGDELEKDFGVAAIRPCGDSTCLVATHEVRESSDVFGLPLTFEGSVDVSMDLANGGIRRVDLLAPMQMAGGADYPEVEADGSVSLVVTITDAPPPPDE